jgi:hypothetical protein
VERHQPQAREAGFSDQLLYNHVHAGNLERVQRAIYRVTRFPESGRRQLTPPPGTRLRRSYTHVPTSRGASGWGPVPPTRAQGTSGSTRVWATGRVWEIGVGE